MDPTRSRAVRFVDTGRFVSLPAATPVVGKPWNMDPVAGSAVRVAEHDGRPVLRYRDYDGTVAELLARPVPLAAYNPGDEILVKGEDVDADGHPVYALAEVAV